MEIDARFKVTEQLDGKMLINGELRGSGCEQWLDSRCPVTQELIGRVPNASAEEMTGAITAAKDASKTWSKTTPKQRVALIEEIAERLEGRADEFAKIEALDTGNTVGPMTNDVHKAVERMRFYCGLAYELKGMTVPSTPENIHLTLREPYGVVGRIIPYNHPIGFAASRIAWPPMAIRPWSFLCLLARRPIWSCPMNRSIWLKGGVTRTPPPPSRSLVMLLLLSAG